MSITNRSYKYKAIWLVWGIILLTAFTNTKTNAQQTQRYNRFQWHKYNWRVLHKKDYHIYFTDGADSLCTFINREAPDVLDALKKNMQKGVSKDPNIIIYPSTDQLYESNIGSYDEGQFTLPTFVAKGNRILLAYNGSYADLKQQLCEALARSIWEEQFNSGGLADQAKGTSANTSSKASPKSEPLPQWFKEGAIRYFADGWTIQAEDQLRTSFEKNAFTSWQQILSYEPRLGGQAFCYYLTERYQKLVVAKIFFQLKKKPSLPRVARLITKHTLDTLYIQCFAYYNKRFKTETDSNKTIAKETITVPHKKGIISHVLLNPKQDYIAYIVGTFNKRTIYIYDIKSKTAKKISTYNLAPWIDDHSADQYPLLQWHNDDHEIYVALPVKGKITIKRYTTDGNLQETTKLYGVDGITSLQPLSDREFLLAAYRKGQSDIVSYNDNKEKYTPYTSDVYDDAYPVLTDNKKGQELLFVSDRPKERKEKAFMIGVGYKKDTLWQGIYSIQGKELKPVTIDTVSYKKWDKANLISDNRLLVTNTSTGAERFEIINYLNKSTTVLNNYQPYQYIPESEQIAFNRADKDSIYITEQPIETWIKENKASAKDTSSPWLTDYHKRIVAQAKEDAILKKAKDTTHSILDDILKPKPKDKKKPAHKANAKDSTGMLQMKHLDKTEPYILQLQSAYFTAKVDNDYFMNRYQPYLNYQGQFQFPALGAMAQGGFTDLLENHHFTIAYRIPSATEGSDFFVKYENTAKKIDWGLSYYRSVTALNPVPSGNWVDANGNPYPKDAKVKTHYYELSLHDPLTYDCSLGLEQAIRKDETIFLATDKYSLDFDPIQSVWSITTFSFKLNKQQPTIPSLFKGFKMDAYVDVFKGFSQDEATLFGSTINLNYSLPLYKYITLVTQLHAGYSGGDEKVLYNIAGEDNNVTPRIDTTIHFPQNAPYAFQTLVTPFRGYYQNSLYGNQYTVINADLYFPIFKTLIPLETPLPSINNLQLGTFSDAGTAGETWNSYNPNNNKWLLSYGLSARTTLAGYPLRVDVAWPGSLSKQPVWYFTLNLQ